MPDSKEKHWLYHLYMQAPVAIGIYIGEEHIIEFANPKMCEVWGRTPEQVLNKPLFTALPEVGDQGFEEILAEVFRTGKPFTGNELPATLQRKGKLELAYFNILYEPLRDEKDNIYGIIQIANEVTGLVEARKKAERNEEILKVALESAKMGTWYFDFIQGTMIRSIEHDKIFGYQEMQPEWSETIFLNHFHPQDRTLAVEGYQNGLKNGHVDYEARILWPDQSEHWIQIKGETSYNLAGKPIGMAGIVIDITERKQAAERETRLAAEQAARAEAERQRKVLHDLFMEAPAMICTLRGPEHTFDLVNPLYQQLFPGRKLEGKPVLEALPELEGQPVIDILDGVYQTGKTFIGNEVPLMLDRAESGQLETLYFNFVYQAMRNAEGTVSGILVFAYEVTELIQARQLVENSEENLRLALEAGKMGTWNLDLLTDTSTRSLQHDQLFGYDELLPAWGYEKFLEHVLPEDRQIVIENHKQGEQKGAFYFEARIIRTDRQIRWAASKGQYFFDEHGKPVRMAGVVMDITDKKKAEEQLKRLTEELATSNEEIQASLEELSLANNQLSKINDDLDNFIYTASHDLKAPISNIEGLVHALVRNLSSESLDRELIKKHIGLIQTSVERFKKTIRELTDIAQVQKEVQETAWINFSDILEEVQADLQPLILASGAQIAINIADCTQIKFSYRNLKSIIYNLLSNAIKYRSAERVPKITISCYQESNYQVLAVQDNGLGIHALGKSKIFSMFKRLHTHVEGSGVGLYLVKKIVDNAGGKVEVESTEGQGSIFKIYVPLAS